MTTDALTPERLAEIEAALDRATAAHANDAGQMSAAAWQASILSICTAAEFRALLAAARREAGRKSNAAFMRRYLEQTDG